MYLIQITNCISFYRLLMHTVHLSMSVNFLRMENSLYHTVQKKINYHFGKLRLEFLDWVIVKQNVLNHILLKYKIIHVLIKIVK